jgi:hypothetical protein
MIFRKNTSCALIPSKWLYCSILYYINFLFVLQFGGPSSDTLLQVTVPTLSDEECIEAYADIFVLRPEMLCAGLPEGGADACEVRCYNIFA